MKPLVHVLLATFNGERHLAEQWASLQAQEGVSIVLHVADDGSTDRTVALVAELQARNTGAISGVSWLRAPPRRSATRSFLALLSHALAHSPDATWLAYCDQDDIWLPGKLAAACKALEVASPGHPALYGGRTLSIDEGGRAVGISPLFRERPCFRNALVQNILGGNTMVMNRTAAMIVARGEIVDVPMHDWYTYQVVCGAGGLVVYDPIPQVQYRQHGANAIGASHGMNALRRRARDIAAGQYSARNSRNVAALLALGEHLDPDARRVLDDFSRARGSTLPWDRLRWLRRSGVFRQPAAQQWSLVAACLFGRL